MSFILDALRKSETERQRGAAPTLSRVPLAPAGRGTPAWIWALLALLAIATIALAGAWWRSMALIRATDSPSAGTALNAAGGPGRANPAQPGPSPGGGPASTGPGGPEGPAPAAPRPISELAARDPGQPTFRLELIAYHPDPAKAYVRINGEQYAVGERVPSGPMIAEIRQDGAVLAYLGDAFLLRPR